MRTTPGGLSACAAAFAALLAGLGPTAACHAQNRWYKGNTHTHTTQSDGDAPPEHVVNWYHDREYNFLVLTDHNKLVDPGTVTMPDPCREDFILIPGEEITGKKVIHTTGLNVQRLVGWDYDDEHKSAIIQNHVDGAIDAGGTPILNHPNFRWALAAQDILPVQRLHLFELFNGHPSVNNGGDAEHQSTEQIWDELLTAGMLMYAVSSDDAHNYGTWSRDRANPGRGWVMVRADELTPDSITSAIASGGFYATTGVILSEVSVSNGTYTVAVDQRATRRQVREEYVIGRHVDDAEPGLIIEAIGPHGRVLASERGRRAAFSIDPSIAYTRVRVTWTRPLRAGQDEHPGGFEQFVAWTQPVFTDGRDRATPNVGGHDQPPP